MVEHFTTCPIAQGTGTDCRCRGVVDASVGYADLARCAMAVEWDEHGIVTKRCGEPAIGTVFAMIGRTPRCEAHAPKASRRAPGGGV